MSQKHQRMPYVGRTPKGAYSTSGRTRHLLETPFSEPLLRTLLRTLFYCKTHRRPPSQNPSENPFPRTLSTRTLPQNPSQNAVLPYAPLGVHPNMTPNRAGPKLDASSGACRGSLERGRPCNKKISSPNWRRTLRIQCSPPPPTPEFLTKDFPSATRSRMETLTKENLVRAKTAPTAVSRTFTPLVRRIRFL